MDQFVFELADFAINSKLLMYEPFGGVMRLVFFEQTENLIGLPAAVMQFLVLEHEFAIKQISVLGIGLLDGIDDLVLERGRKPLVGIEKQYPLVFAAPMAKLRWSV
jgi:hypothetical protein